MRKILTSATLTVILLIAGDALAEPKFVTRLLYVPPKVSYNLRLGRNGAVAFTLGTGLDRKDITFCTIEGTSSGCYGKSPYSEAALLSIYAALLKVLGTDMPVWLESNGSLGIGR